MFEFPKKRKASEKINWGEIERSLHAYGDVLCEKRAFVMNVARLPAPKSTIKAALMAAIATTQSEEERSALEVSYLHLADFQESVGSQGIDCPSFPSGTITEEFKEELKRFLHWTEVVLMEYDVLKAELQQPKIQATAKPESP